MGRLFLLVPRRAALLLIWISISPDNPKARRNGLPFASARFRRPDHVAGAALAGAEVEALIARHVRRSDVAEQCAQKGRGDPHWRPGI